MDNTFFDISQEMFFLVPGELRYVELVSAATPSFVTLMKGYFGSDDAIRRILKVNGYEDAPDVTELPKARIIGARGFWANDVNNYHLNIWGCTYHIFSRKVMCLMVWLECNGLFYRCFRAAFYQPLYKAVGSKHEAQPLAVSWGPEELFDFNPERIKNNLFEIDKPFDSEEELLQDLRATPGIPEYEPFFDDIFADG